MSPAPRQHKPRPKTKIIATIGPASDSPEVMRKLIDAGMNVARLNFSHGSHSEHLRRVEMIRKVAAEAKANIAIMLDTRGFEIRTQPLAGEPVLLADGQTYWLYADDHPGTADGVGITYRNLADHAEVGQRVLVDDGLIELIIEEFEGAHARCRVINGGLLKSRKGVNVPGVDLHESALCDQDKEDLRFAVEHDLDYIAASFVRSAGDIRDIRAFVQDLGGSLPIIAKIENRQAVENLVSIIVEADGAMVARGDLGVEIPVEEIPLMQKRIIRTTVMNGKPVITATQMLDSMERNPRPTRAETTDVANAIFDGTSAVMLSGETAAGKYPVEAIETMARLAVEAESSLQDFGVLQKINPHPSQRVTEAVSQAAITMANHLDAAAILTLTQSGFTSRSISKYRPRCPILAITRNDDVVRKLSMNWGITAVKLDESDDDKMVDAALAKAVDEGILQTGDRVVITAGISNQPGSTSTIRVQTVV